MTRIYSQGTPMFAAHELQAAHDRLSTSLERLSSGLRINSGKDDPGGLIASELLRAEVGNLQQAIENSERAANTVATAEGALNEVSAILVDIRSLAVEAASSGSVTSEEIEASQTAIDAAVDAIDRISRSTAFNGKKLLDGSAGYRTSGVAAATIDDLKLLSVEFGDATTVPVSVNYITSAQTAQVELSNSNVTSTVTIEVAGNLGTQVFTFVSGTTVSAIAQAINQVADSTGISAALVDGSDITSGLYFNSTEFGSDQFVSVRVVDGPASAMVMASNTTRDTGQDAVATVNGQMARGSGRTVMLNTSNLDLEMTFDATAGLGTTSFTVTGGGLEFQLGPEISPQNRLNVGIASINSTQLGAAAVGHLDDITSSGTRRLSATDGPEYAAKIIDAAMNQVNSQRARLGSIERDVIGRNVATLQVALENVSAAESAIRDTDFAAETARLTREQILVQAGTSVLATTNSLAGNVLQLLR